MTNIIYLGPNENFPLDHHVVVVIHKNEKGVEKGYFYDSNGKDFGGSGPFDWVMDEAIERSKKYATVKGISTVVVRAKQE
ncbi:hypothetical protein AA14337_1046 [Acetobacter malorum DSM 14337]|uniref:Phage protein n=1 Tax=Acetobacter malorum DSM 14337 TaxID=1307910 RepID=A0ABQ0PQD6_9PROT|nr:hypothetical protein [Acetobacter malorum]KXV05442.1 hypothetical protein AD930_12380 [Acetobacter malorum]GBQ78132.1 hypothetical protein AA14337_1046 [Acetobacter malorum DSM 14337]